MQRRHEPLFLLVHDGSRNLGSNRAVDSSVILTRETLSTAICLMDRCAWNDKREGCTVSALLHFLHLQQLGRVLSNQGFLGESHLLQLLSVRCRNFGASHTDRGGVQVVEGVFRGEGQDFRADSE